MMVATKEPKGALAGMLGFDGLKLRTRDLSVGVKNKST
jgi:hypothetical protein